MSHWLRNEVRLTVGETFYAQDISKVNAHFSSARWAWTVTDLVILEYECVRNILRPVDHKRGAKRGKNQRVKTNEGPKNLEAQSKPQDSQQCTSRQIKEIIAEFVILECDSANSRVFEERCVMSHRCIFTRHLCHLPI